MLGLAGEGLLGGVLGVDVEGEPERFAVGRLLREDLPLRRRAAVRALGHGLHREARCAPVTPPVTILAVVHRTTRATSDAHNVAPTIKAIVDAAVAAGLIPDDNDDVVTEQTTRGRGEILRPVDPLTRRRTARPAITLTITTTRQDAPA